MLPRLSLIAACGLLCAAATSPAAQTAQCANLNPAIDGDADRAFQCITDLETRLAELTALVAAIDPAPEIPGGAVMAFDLSGGCPAGWSPFRAGQGRAIVGASFGAGAEPGLGRNEDGRDLIEYKYRDHGGVEDVVLAPSQMPTHAHITTPPILKRAAYVWWYPWGISDKVPKDFGHPANEENFSTMYRLDPLSGYPLSSPAGGDQPHRNMPPYLALYFCKKD